MAVNGSVPLVRDVDEVGETVTEIAEVVGLELGGGVRPVALPAHPGIQAIATGKIISISSCKSLWDSK